MRQEPRAQPAPSPPAGTPGRALRLEALRLLLFKLLLFDVLLTCGRLRAPPAGRRAPRAGRPPAAQPRRVREPLPPPTAMANGKAQGSDLCPPSGSGSRREPSPGGGDALCPPSAQRSGPAFSMQTSRLGGHCDLPPPGHELPGWGGGGGSLFPLRPIGGKGCVSPIWTFEMQNP